MRTRALPALLLMPALLAACGGSDSSQPLSAAADDTITIEHAAGTTDVPADPQRIVTTTDQNALLPLLELGVRPVGSAGLVGDDGSQTFRRTEGFDTAGITFTGAYGEPNVEAVAALKPDLIVGYEFDEEYYDDLSRVAPTVLVRIFDRPLTDALDEFAALVGRQDEAKKLQEQYDTRIAALRERLGERAERLSVTLVSAGDPGTFYRADTGQALGTVMADLGLPQAAAQAADIGDDPQSLEQLGTRDADVVLVVDYGGESPDPGTQVLLNSPAYARLAAVRAGQAHVVDGTKSVGAAWARMNAFLDVLERHLTDARADVVTE